MMIEAILAFLALIAIIEGILVFLNPLWAKTITNKLIRHSRTLKTMALIEVIIGVLLLWIALR